MQQARDHGGEVDAAAARWGGDCAGWLDLSTGIDPVPCPPPTLPARTWTDPPHIRSQTALTDSARRFWSVPDRAGIADGTAAFPPCSFDVATARQDRLARQRIRTRTFPYPQIFPQLGLPPAEGRARVDSAPWA